jgi:hypothetical protein
MRPIPLGCKALITPKRRPQPVVGLGAVGLEPDRHGSSYGLGMVVHGLTLSAMSTGRGRLGSSALIHDTGDQSEAPSNHRLLNHAKALAYAYL